MKQCSLLTKKVRPIPRLKARRKTAVQKGNDYCLSLPYPLLNQIDTVTSYGKVIHTIGGLKDDWQDTIISLALFPIHDHKPI